jgi:hypothetical protein
MGLKIDPSGFEIPASFFDPSPQPTGWDLKSRRVYFQTLSLHKDDWGFFFGLPCIDKEKN